MIIASVSQPEEGTSRGLLRDCEIVANLRIAFVSSSNCYREGNIMIITAAHILHLHPWEVIGKVWPVWLI